MFASTVFSAGGYLLTIILILGIAVDKSCSFEETSSSETQADDVVFQTLENENGSPSNRVLPVDAEHNSKISFPTNPLDAFCVKTLKDNLLKFLKRARRSEGKRKGKQDDGDDGDDGEEGIQGVINNLAEGNGALSVLSAVPEALPQLVNTLTQLSGAINQGLNGTDTPNIPSFLAKQSMDAIKFFQAISGSVSHAQAAPQMPIHVQRIPGTNPVRKPRPPAAGGSGGGGGGAANYEYPTDPDYPEEEDVKQPQQPSLKPLKPGEVAGGKYPGVEAIPGSDNPFFNADLLPTGIRRPAQPTADPNAQFIDGLPSRTSLWSIYKSFRNKGLGNGTLTAFQLAHPDAFSNELLQSISQQISSNRGQAPPQVPVDKPTSEILQQLFPANKPSAFVGLNRPTLSVYKPAVSNSGIGIDLSNIAWNATNNLIDENEQSNAGNTNNEYSEEATSSPNQEQQELEASDLEGLKKRVPGGLGSTSNFGYHHLQQGTSGSSSTGQHHSQQGLESESNGNAQFVKSPTSSHLTITQGEYVPAIASLHEGDDQINKIGPQTNYVDNANGIKNRTPYNKVKGVLIEAPRLTPSPYLNLKRPAGLTGNFGSFTSQIPTTTTPTPNLSYQFLNSHQNAGSYFPPGAASYRPSDPNAPRAPALIASIPSTFQLSQNPLKTNGIVPSSLIPNSGHPTPESETVNVAIITTEAYVSNNGQPLFIPTKVEAAVVEEDLEAPEDDKQSIISSNNAAAAPNSQSVPPPSTSGTNQAAPQYNSSVSLLSLYQKLGNQPIQSQLLANALINTNVEKAPSLAASTTQAVELVQETTPKVSILALPSNSGLKFGSSLTANQAQNQGSSLVQSLLSNLKVPQLQKPDVTLSNQGNSNVESLNTNNLKEPEMSSTLFIPTSTVSTAPQKDIISSTPIPGRSPVEENNNNASPQKVAPVQSILPPLASFFPFPSVSQFLQPQGQPTKTQFPSQVLSPPTTTSAPTTQPTTKRAPPAITNQNTGAPISSNLLVTGNYNFQQNSKLPDLPTFSFPSAVNPQVGNQNYLINSNPPVATKNQEIPNINKAKNDTVVKSEPEPTTPRPINSNIIGGTWNFANLAPSPLFPTHIQNAVNANPSNPAPGGPLQLLTTENKTFSQYPSQQPSKPNPTTTTTTPSPPKPPSKVQQQIPSQTTLFPPFASALGFWANPNKAAPVRTTTKKPTTNTTTTTTMQPKVKPATQHFFPQSISSGLPVSSIYSPKVPTENGYKPIIISNTGFQGPVQSSGYPSYVPSTSVNVGVPPPPIIPNQSYVSNLNAELPPSAIPNFSKKPNFGPPGVISDVLSQAQQNRIPSTPQVLDSPQSAAPGGPFSETLATQNVGMSAIAEMSKLPFYQEDTFRPSALPPHMLISENEDYSLEKVDAETNTKSPTISELFSSISKVSQKVKEQTTTTALLTTITATTPANSVSPVAVEDDYSEQEIPNFPPGKPAYWMNMYYPNGVPVLTKVRPAPTSENPRRRRTRRTTPSATTPEDAPGTEADSYEYEEGSSTKIKRKKLATT